MTESAGDPMKDVSLGSTESAVGSTESAVSSTESAVGSTESTGATMRESAERPLMREIVSDCVVVVEVRHDPADITLYPQEEAVIGRAVEKRRREFATARMCARTALSRLGFPPVAIPTGERGEPRWPTGVVGSITHCESYRASAVARRRDIAALGIDAEPNAELPDGLLGDIARPEELPRLRRLAAQRPDVHWDRLLFSAKESVYKAWFPLAERWLGFEDAVIEIDPEAGTFEAKLLVAGPRLHDAPLRGFSGRWMAHDGLVLTAIAVNAS
jgi:4'-phosphopantetheinyl transferase EntD